VGIWIELGVFAIVLAFGIWQLHDVGMERRKREDLMKTADTSPDSDREEPPD
jgi:hypothetical protein